MIRRSILLAGLIVGVFALLASCVALNNAPRAHADQLACPYPFVGPKVQVNVAVEVVGGWCDGPTEINGTHYHCPYASVVAGGTGIELAPLQGVAIGGIASGGIGGGGGECNWFCPDGTRGPQPNPPGAWKDYLVVRPGNNSCIGHMQSAGPTSDVVEPDQGPPGWQPPNVLPPQLPDSFTVPDPLLPTVTNPGQGNPDAAP